MRLFALVGFSLVVVRVLPRGNATFTHLSIESSVTCPAGYYFAAGSASLSCRACPLPTWSIAGSTSCPLCAAGYFYHQATCYECPSGAECAAGSSTLSALDLNRGYWRLSDASTEVLSCDSARMCEGGTIFSDGGDGYCAEGYAGPLCGACDAGYFREATTGWCDHCDGSSDTSSAGVAASKTKTWASSYVESVSTVALSLIIFFAFIAWPQRTHRNFKTFLTFAQSEFCLLFCRFLCPLRYRPDYFDVKKICMSSLAQSRQTLAQTAPSLSPPTLRWC